jgi:hypothetical protein
VPLRALLLLAACAALLAGCGDDERGPLADSRPCPGGTPELKVRDVLPEPPGRLVYGRADPDVVAQTEQVFKTAFGEALRSLPIDVVVNRSGRYHSVLMVANLTKRIDEDELTDGSGDMLTKRVTLGGRPAQLRHRNAEVTAVVRAGPCAMVILKAADEADLRRVGAALDLPK